MVKVGVKREKDLEKEYARLYNALTDLSHENREYKNNITDLRVVVMDKDTQLDELRVMNDSFSDINLEVRRDLDKLKSQVKRLKTKNTLLKRKYEPKK